MNLSDSKKKLALAGAICGLVAACLAFLGNPANMAFCIACFIRDTAGALGMHQAEVVQYVRPEIVGLVIGGKKGAVPPGAAGAWGDRLVLPGGDLCGGQPGGDLLGRKRGCRGIGRNPGTLEQGLFSPGDFHAPSQPDLLSHPPAAVYQKALPGG